MVKNEPFLKVLTAPWVWMGGVNPHLQKKQNKNNTKNPAGLLKESAQIFEYIPNGGCQWDRKYIYIYMGYI